MKNMMKLVAVAAFVLAAMSVSAQVKLGHINTQELIQAMPEVARANDTLEMKQAAVEKELTNMQEQLKTKTDEYSKNAASMTEVIRASKEQELNDLYGRIQSFQQIAMQDLEATQRRLMQPIMDKVLNAIKAVGKENGYTYIFDLSAGGLLYFAETADDVMPLVKKKLGLQ